MLAPIILQWNALRGDDSTDSMANLVAVARCQEGARMEEAFGEVAVVKRRAEAIAPGIVEQLAAHAGAHRVTVAADNTGEEEKAAESK